MYLGSAKLGSEHEWTTRPMRVRHTHNTCPTRSFAASTWMPFLYQTIQEENEAGGRDDRKNLMQFGRAMKHLGIDMIIANSPEARGRS
jgi:hypothetical protein